MASQKRFLFLGASNDDCEWMAGGLARVLVKDGHHVAFACAPPLDRRELYAALTHEAWGIIGVQERIIMPRGLREIDDEACTAMIGEVVDRVRPDVCFIQPADDYMAHHVRFARASFRALLPDMRPVQEAGAQPAGCFRVSEVYAMECPSAPYTRVDFYVDVSDTLADALDALLVYDKWNEGFGSVMAQAKGGLATLRGALRVTGACEYAEGFKIVKAHPGCISSLPDVLGPRFSAHPFPKGYGPPAYGI